VSVAKVDARGSVEELRQELQFAFAAQEEKVHTYARVRARARAHTHTHIHTHRLSPVSSAWRNLRVSLARCKNRSRLCPVTLWLCR
jgi:hypothetical protein